MSHRPSRSLLVQSSRSRSVSALLRDGVRLRCDAADATSVRLERVASGQRAWLPLRRWRPDLPITAGAAFEIQLAARTVATGHADGCHLVSLMSNSQHHTATRCKLLRDSPLVPRLSSNGSSTGKSSHRLQLVVVEPFMPGRS